MDSKKSYYFHITITQVICLILILAYILSLKFIFKGQYNDLKKWYSEEICQDTKIEEVLK